MRPSLPPLLLDENVPFGVCAWLRENLDLSAAFHVYDLQLQSSSDQHLYDWALANQAVIVTFDEDFADQRRFPVGGNCGIVRLRVETTQEDTCEAIDRLVKQVPLNHLLGKLAIVDARRIRIIG